jgi:hypothetical protein
MAGNNTYGIVRPALVSAADVEIFYNYKPTRNSTDTSFSGFRKIEDPSSVFNVSTLENSDISDTRLPGMYNLKLPVDIFGRKGFYTIFIRPKEIICTIKDVGVLSAYPDIRGIVLDLNDMSNEDRSIFSNDNLIGYRVEYFNYSGGLQRQDYYRIVTSNNLCETVSQNLTSANTNSNGYRFNASGTLCFITLTPSTSPSFKANSNPYIGTPNQRIVLTNTKFDPISIEVEMVEHDIETVSMMLEGEQVRNLDNGRVSTYNWDGEIYHQDEFSTVKDNYTGRSIAELKLNKTGNIDTSLDLETLRND